MVGIIFFSFFLSEKEKENEKRKTKNEKRKKHLAQVSTYPFCPWAGSHVRV